MDIKEIYTPPTSEVLEMTLEGVIAASTDELTLPGYGAGELPKP